MDLVEKNGVNSFHEEPILSVLCITYNHEKFINQTIDGFLMQQTSFGFEIVIGEDCSIDRTREICLEYKRKSPDKIRLLLSEKNQGLMSNFIATLEACRGKYIAVCGGDDYWTDPLKLQKQVDFLEANLDYSMCGHNSLNFWDNDREHTILHNLNKHGRDYTAEELYRNWSPFQASTNVFRKAMFNYPNSFRKYVAEDVGLYLSLAEAGKVRYMSEVMSCYRRHDNGQTSDVSYERMKKWFEQLDYMDIDFNRRYKHISDRGYRRRYLSLCRKCVGVDFWEGLKYLFYSVYYDPKLMFKWELYKVFIKLLLPVFDGIRLHNKNSK